jgi:hypothetical protein
VAPSQKLVWAVQRMQRLPQELATEGALAALRLITEVSLQYVYYKMVAYAGGLWAVQRMQRLPQELATEGALTALRLITEVRVPKFGLMDALLACSVCCVCINGAAAAQLQHCWA